MKDRFELISDLYKDAMGVRPSSQWLKAFQLLGDDCKQAVWDDLAETLEFSIKEQRENHAKAIEAYEVLVANTMATCNCTRKKAVHYILDGAESLSDTSYYEYHNGLPLGYIEYTKEERKPFGCL